MLIGLTGGVATGKSLVTDELKRLGALVIDADIIAREVLRPGDAVYEAVLTEFGESILDDSNEIDRKKLGNMVFNDSEKLKMLNSLTHPEIIRRMKARVEALERGAPGALVVIDAPLLIEVGMHKDVDRVIVIYADNDRQIERLRTREGISVKEAITRISAQIPMEEKIKLADHIIDNSGTKEATIKAVQELYKELKTSGD